MFNGGEGANANVPIKVNDNTDEVEPGVAVVNQQVQI